MYSAGIIFDADDTLWETMPFYTEAKKEFFREMAQLDFNAVEVERVFESTDKANVARFGFSKDRFPTSMAETYRLFCERYHRRPEETIDQKMRAIGYSVFSKRPLLLDHTEQVLTQLRRYYTLILATKGDQEVQQSKVEHSGLSSYFHAIYVLGQKTEQELRQIIRECELDVARSWAVGNSLKSDINPALRVGLRAIWIPHYTWDYEEDARPDSSRLYQIASLEGILQILVPERK